MDTVMHIGAKVEKEDAENFANSIATIFKSAHENRIEQSNVKCAIDAFARVFEVKHVTVTNSNFVGEDKRVIVNNTNEEE